MTKDISASEKGSLESSEEVLEDAPCAFLSALPDGKILRVNAKVVEWTGKSRDQLLSNTRLQELLPKGEQIYFETHVRPLLLAQGFVKEIACHLVRHDGPSLPVFMNCSLKMNDSGKPLLIRVTFFDASDRMKYEEELQLRRRQADQLGAIVTSSTDAIVSMGLDLVVQTWNAGASELFGYSPQEAVGQPIDALIVPNSKVEERESLFKSVLEGRKTVLCETERLHKNGKAIPVELRASPIRDVSDRTTAISVIFRDITDRQKAEEQIKFVQAELNHRTRNLMGIILAISRLSSKTTDLESFRSDFDARLTSLADNQDLLIKGGWKSIDLAVLIQTQVDHFFHNPRDQMKLEGPKFELFPDAAQALGMAFHELATNAVKHGALSQKGGWIKITWSLEPRFEIEWSEHDGPAVQEPVHTGFGSTVLKQMVEADTGGHVDISYRSTGFSWKLVAPLDEIQKKSNR